MVEPAEEKDIMEIGEKLPKLAGYEKFEEIEEFDVVHSQLGAKCIIATLCMVMRKKLVEQHLGIGESYTQKFLKQERIGMDELWDSFYADPAGHV